MFCGAQIGIWSIIKQEGKEPIMEADANMRELLGLTIFRKQKMPV